METKRSQELFQEAQQHLVGGVNSPVRAFKSVGGNPLFIERGEGPWIFDVDGNRYLDLVGSYGPLILGHAHPEVREALQEAAARGTSYGATTEMEIELAKLVKEAYPHIDLVRFVNSGTEAVMSALRLARGYTGRKKLVKFAGCYHGHMDALLAEAGSGLATQGLPASAGVPEHVVQDTFIAPYNDLEHVRQLFQEHGDDIAAVTLEPVAGNMGVVLPEEGFLQGLRDLTREHGALLIFDEVMCGFRKSFGGASTDFGIKPDLTTLGKIIGGGLPVGAYGGRKEIMEQVAPLGPVYQAGTLSGNPLAMTAGYHTLRLLKEKPEYYQQLTRATDQLERGMREALQEKDVDAQVNRWGSMICPFFTNERVRDFSTAKKANTQRFSQFFWKLIENGVYIPPSQFEAWFVPAVAREQEVEHVLKAFKVALQR